MLLGNPGSGKTVFTHKLLEVFGGLNTKDKNEMIKVLEKNKAVPILINLKNCMNDSIENIIRSRKNDSKVNNIELGFIYLFDGLDELDEMNADIVLNQLYELSQKSNTKKMIISCRSGNLNRIKAKTYFNDIVSYKIHDLDISYLDNYFNTKSIDSKSKKLKNFKENNIKLINDIKDILFIKLFWDTIEKLDGHSTILDLISKKINLLLNEPYHRKNIESTPLPIS